MNLDTLALDNCLKCSLCVTHCPVARVTKEYAGPKYYGPDLERFRLETKTPVDSAIAYCSNCKSCDNVCPSGVKVSTMITRGRGALVAQQGATWRDRALSRVDLLGSLCAIAPRVVNRAGKNKLIRVAAERLFGLSRHMPFPRYAPKNFHSMLKGHQTPAGNRKVVYYPGCYVTYNAPEVGLALVKVLEMNGVGVVVDKFECCGLPLVANGLLAEAERKARNDSHKLRAFLAQGLQIITSCPSCNLTLRQELQELFALDPENHLRNGVLDIFEYLLLLEEQGELNKKFAGLPLRMGYHQPCHLKAGGLVMTTLSLLRLIPGLEVAELDAGCCGGSGTYSFKKEKYEISREIGGEIIRAIEELKVDQVLTECGMCQLQIKHSAGIGVCHPIQVVANAYKNGYHYK